MIGVRTIALFWTSAIFIAIQTTQLQAKALGPPVDPPVAQSFVVWPLDLPNASSSRLSPLPMKLNLLPEAQTIRLNRKTVPQTGYKKNSEKSVDGQSFLKLVYDPRATPLARTALKPDPPATDPEHASRQDTSEEYRIGPEDVLKIRVFQREDLYLYQREDLADEFRVRSNGTVSLPLVGSIRVEDMNEADIERAVASKIQKLTNRSPIVNVEIAQRRPFFITGEVQNPGSYPFVPGMTVKHAIAISGGVFRLSRTFETFAIEGARENARTRDTLVRLRHALATHARLSAELAKASDISIPPRLLEISSQEEAEALMEAEKQTMLANLKAFENLETNYKREISFGVEQIVALKQQRKYIGDQIQLNTNRAERIEKLFSRGLSNEARVIEVQTLVARLLGEGGRVDSGIAFASSRKAEAEREIANARDRRYSELSAELSNTTAEIKRYEEALRESSKIMQQIDGISGLSENDSQSPLRHTIMRRKARGHQFFRASTTTRLHPGDVLEVTVEKQSRLTPPPASQ